MGACVPTHIICDTYDSGYVPSNASATLPIGNGTFARSVDGSGTISTRGGALWRSRDYGPTGNTITIDVVWVNIRRFNGFAFSNPPATSVADASTEYVEIDVRADIYVDGQLAESTPQFLQTAEWTAIDTNDDNIDDTTTLCWSCTNNTTDTSTIINGSLRPHINSNSSLVTLPTDDYNAKDLLDDGLQNDSVTAGDTDVTTFDDDHIGPPNADILADGANIDSSASNAASYTIETFNLAGASLSEPSSSTTGPLFTLQLLSTTESSIGVTEESNQLRYWGQQTQASCYNLTWLPLNTTNDPDCGIPITGFDAQQNAFIIDDLIGSQFTGGDTLKVFGPPIEEASNKTVADYSSYRMTFQVVSASEPGDGTTHVIIDEALPSLYSTYQAVAAICRSNQCI